MSSSSSDMESLTTARGSVFSAVTRKWKVALSVFLLLGAVAAIGVCAAVVVASTSHGEEGEGEQESSRSMEDLTVETETVRSRRIPGRPNSKTPPIRKSCYSDTENDTLPAAHIKGRGQVWQVDGDNDHYTPQWDCKGSLAFVSGGMWFYQENKSLYVPKCGWYYVMSEIAHQSTSQQAQNYSHKLKIDRNCDSAGDSYSHMAFTLAGPLGKASHGKMSTSVGDIVKICTGGRIYVEIPKNYNACCPRGDESVTSLTAHLVAESDCQWPISSYDEPVETFQNLTK